MAMDVENRDPLGFPQWIPIRRRFGPDAPFFASGNIERELLAKQFECLVEGCGMKLKSYKSRQQRLIDKHEFPASFEFFEKAMHRRNKGRRTNENNLFTRHRQPSAMQVEDETMDGLVSAVSKLNTSDTSPSSISFGCRHIRGFTFVPRALQCERGPDSSPAGAKR